MKILFIADNVPAMHSGSVVRNYYILKALSQKNTVDLIGLTDDINNVNTEIYKKLKNVTYTLLERKKITNKIKLLYLLRGKIPYIEQRKKLMLPNKILSSLHNYDLIHLAELNSYFILEKYKKHTTKVILDAHNVEYRQLKSELKNKSLLKKLIFKQFLRKLQYEEIAISKKVSHLLVCSSIDKEYFKNYMQENKISVIPNGVNIAYFNEKIKKLPNDTSEKCIILFMGLLAYYPNDEGLHYYLTTIYPEIKKNISHVEFHIIGKNAPEWLVSESTKDNSIKLHGFVNDTRPYIANATVCVAPLLSGSGTRLKILEYMAMKKAIVATPKGAEGIAVENKKNILIAKNPNEFIQAMLLLNRNKTLRNQLGENAYTLVKTTYDWDSIGDKVNALYENFNG